MFEVKEPVCILVATLRFCDLPVEPSIVGKVIHIESRTGNEIFMTVLVTALKVQNSSLHICFPSINIGRGNFQEIYFSTEKKVWILTRFDGQNSESHEVVVRLDKTRTMF